MPRRNRNAGGIARDRRHKAKKSNKDAPLTGGVAHPSKRPARRK